METFKHLMATNMLMHIFVLSFKFAENGSSIKLGHQVSYTIFCYYSNKNVTKKWWKTMQKCSPTGVNPARRLCKQPSAFSYLLLNETSLTPANGLGSVTSYKCLLQYYFVKCRPHFPHTVCVLGKLTYHLIKNGNYYPWVKNTIISHFTKGCKSLSMSASVSMTILWMVNIIFYIYIYFFINWLQVDQPPQCPPLSPCLHVRCYWREALRR